MVRSDKFVQISQSLTYKFYFIFFSFTRLSAVYIYIYIRFRLLVLFASFVCLKAEEIEEVEVAFVCVCIFANQLWPMRRHWRH